MARPLSKTILEKMAVSVETSTGAKILTKQVGYNKYIVSDNTIVTLKKQIENDSDAVLKIVKGDKELFVTKISLHIMHTEEGAFAYTVEENGVKFIDKSVSFASITTEEEPTKATQPKTTKQSSKPTEQPKTETVVVEEPKAEEPKPTVVEEAPVEEPKTETVAE